MSEVFEIIKEIIWTLISESIRIIVHLGKLFIDLLKAISPLSTSGPTGFIISALIIAGIGFFIGKYVLHVGKNSVILLIFGSILFIAAITSVI